MGQGMSTAQITYKSLVREPKLPIATSLPPYQRVTPERLSKEQQFRIKDNIQCIVGAVSVLLRAEEIDQAQAGAAERWYRDYVMGVIGARDPEQRGSGKAPDVHASMLSRTAAIARCRVVREGLGSCGEERLKLFLIDELTFSAIAGRLFPGDGNGRKKIAAQIVFILQQLAEIYHLIDKRCRPKHP